MSGKVKNYPKKAIDFDEKLLSHIRCSRNDEAKSMITRDLAKASDGFGTLLHYAANYGNTTITRYLIELGSAIDFLGRGKKTPLMLAVSGGRTAAMKALLNADADIHIADDDGQSALRAALNRDYLNCDIVEPFVRKLQTKIRATKDLADKLIDSGGNMYHATTLGDVKLLEHHLELGVDVNSKGPNGGTGLHVAAEFNHYLIASWLIKNGAYANALDNRGNTAFHVSAKNGSKDVVQILLKHGADFNLTGRRDGFTPADLSAKSVDSGEQFIKCLELFCKHGAKRTLVGLTSDELWPKISLGYDFAELQSTRNPPKKFDDGGNFLKHAVVCGNASAAKLFIELGSKVDHFEAGRTPLMLAVQYEKAAIVEILLRANANVELKNDKGRSALTMALEPNFFNTIGRVFIRKLLTNNRSRDELTRILVDAGANMYHVVCSKDIELMKCALERGIDVDSRGQRGKTGLHEAAGWTHTIFAELLIERGADVNAIDDDGQSPLISAASIRSKVVLKILLERGANPNLKNRNGFTPLLALFQGSGLGSILKGEGVDCLELLLQYGATPELSTRYGSIFKYALNSSSDEGIRVLVSHLAMLEARGVSVTKSIMRAGDYQMRHRSKVLKFEEFHETCLRLLETPVFGKLSLCDLLNGSESRLQSLVRNEEFVAGVRKVCELGELNSYYCKRAMDHINKAIRVVTLKNEAMQAVCKLFDGNYDECYIFARKVVDYLEVCDLEKLVVMAKTFQT